jgi:hypothetical protein
MRLDVSELNLQEGEYIIGLRAVYGGVVKGFYTGTGFGDAGSTAYGQPDLTTLDEELGTYHAFELRDWWYSVVATGALLTQDEMGNETVMRGSIQADLFRNWGGDAPVLTDVDNDQVETRVIETFAYSKQDLGINPGSFLGGFFRWLPFTGDNSWALGGALVLISALGCSLVALGARKRRKLSAVEDANE